MISDPEAKPQNDRRLECVCLGQPVVAFDLSLLGCYPAYVRLLYSLFFGGCMDRDQYVGYDLGLRGAILHRGITARPVERQGEHRRATGAPVVLRTVTRPMSLPVARSWERRQRRTRGYHRRGFCLRQATQTWREQGSRTLPSALVSLFCLVDCY